MATLKGKVSISRIKSNKEEDTVVITLHDELSGVKVIDIEIGMLEFAQVITGLSYIECEFNLNTSGTVGKNARIDEQGYSVHPISDAL